MAPRTHASTHDPQSVQASASVTRTIGRSATACDGGASIAASIPVDGSGCGAAVSMRGPQPLPSRR
jgi:hypothetical protein